MMDRILEMGRCPFGVDGFAYHPGIGSHPTQSSHFHSDNPYHHNVVAGLSCFHQSISHYDFLYSSLSSHGIHHHNVHDALFVHSSQMK
jgi:hypothetical protein